MGGGGGHRVSAAVGSDAVAKAARIVTTLKAQLGINVAVNTVAGTNKPVLLYIHVAHMPLRLAHHLQHNWAGTGRPFLYYMLAC